MDDINCLGYWGIGVSFIGWVPPTVSVCGGPFKIDVRCWCAIRIARSAQCPVAPTPSLACCVCCLGWCLVGTYLRMGLWDTI